MTRKPASGSVDLFELCQQHSKTKDDNQIKIADQINEILNKNPDALLEKNRSGQTPLSIALYTYGIETVKLLLPHVKNINAEIDENGNRAIHRALHNIEIFQAVLGVKDVNLNIQNNKGKTPLDKALIKSYSYSEVLALLIADQRVTIDGLVQKDDNALTDSAKKAFKTLVGNDASTTNSLHRIIAHLVHRVNLDLSDLLNVIYDGTTNANAERREKADAAVKAILTELKKNETAPSSIANPVASSSSTSTTSSSPPTPTEFNPVSAPSSTTHPSTTSIPLPSSFTPPMTADTSTTSFSNNNKNEQSSSDSDSEDDSKDDKNNDKDSSSTSNASLLTSPALSQATIDMNLYCNNGILCKVEVEVVEEKEKVVESKVEYLVKNNVPCIKNAENGDLYHEIRTPNEARLFICNGKLSLKENKIQNANSDTIIFGKAVSVDKLGADFIPLTKESTPVAASSSSPTPTPTPTRSTSKASSTPSPTVPETHNNNSNTDNDNGDEKPLGDNFSSSNSKNVNDNENNDFIASSSSNSSIASSASSATSSHIPQPPSSTAKPQVGSNGTTPPIPPLSPAALSKKTPAPPPAPPPSSSNSSLATSINTNSTTSTPPPSNPPPKPKRNEHLSVIAAIKNNFTPQNEQDYEAICFNLWQIKKEATPLGEVYEAINQKILELNSATFEEKINPQPEAYGGIGIAFKIIDDKVIVQEVAVGSPAAAAGIETGWKITAINGIDKWPPTAEEIITLIRGPLANKTPLITFANAEGEEMRNQDFNRALIINRKNLEKEPAFATFTEHYKNAFSKEKTSSSGVNSGSINSSGKDTNTFSKFD